MFYGPKNITKPQTTTPLNFTIPAKNLVASHNSLDSYVALAMQDALGNELNIGDTVTLPLTVTSTLPLNRVALQHMNAGGVLNVDADHVTKGNLAKQGFGHFCAAIRKVLNGETITTAELNRISQPLQASVLTVQEHVLKSKLTDKLSKGLEAANQGNTHLQSTLVQANKDAAVFASALKATIDGRSVSSATINALSLYQVSLLQHIQDIRNACQKATADSNKLLDQTKDLTDQLKASKTSYDVLAASYDLIEGDKATLSKRLNESRNAYTELSKFLEWGSTVDTSLESDSKYEAAKVPAPEREIVAAILHRLAKAENKDKAATPDYQGLCELHVARINNLQAEVGCLRREIIPLSEAKQFHENAHNSIFQCNTHLSTENKQLRADCAALQAKLDDAQLKAIAWSDDNAKLKQRILDLGFKLKVKPAVPDYMAVLKRCMGGELTPEETTQTTITNECAFDALREAVLAHSVIPKVMEAAQAKANAKLDVALAEHMRATANKIVDDILTHGEGTGNPGSLWSTARPYTNESAGEFSNFPFTLADLREVKRNSDAGPYWTSLTIRKESTPGVAVKAANRMPVVASTDRSADNVAAKSTRPLQGVQVSNELLDDCILDLGSTLFKAPPTMSPREAAAFLHLGGRLVNPTDSSEFMAKADEDKLQLHKMSDCSISDTLLLTSSILEHLTVLHNHGLHLVRFVPSAGLKKQWRKQLKTQANAKGLTLEFPGDNTALLKGPGWELGYGADNFYSRVRSKLQAYEMPSKAAEPAEPAPGVRGGHMTWEQAKAAMHAGAAVRGEMFRAGVRILKAKDDKYPTLIAPGGYTRSYPFDDAALTDIKWFVFDEHLTTNQAIAAATEGAKIHKIGWPIGAYSACLYVLVGVPCLSCVDVTDVQAFADNSDDAMWVIVN